GDDLSWIRIALSAGVIVALVVTAVRWRQTRPTFTFGVGWFFIAILPTSNLLFPIGSIFAERFLYLPSVGYCIVLGAALDRWRVKGGLQGKLAIGSLVSICLLYAAGTVERNRDWATDETLMVSVVKNAPNSAMGRYEMGRIRQEQRRENEAKQLYKEAIDIYPDFALAHYNRGQIYRLHGEYDAAILDYMEAIRVDPNFAEAYHNLGISRSRQGHHEEAIEDIQEAVSRNPRLELAWMDLFKVLQELERYEEAIQALEGLIEANPNSVAAHLRAFEIYYADLEDLGKARMYLQKAYRISPDHPDIKALPPKLLELLE
ncbi:MAG: tetratricopeptide repeat protein, partial [Planctomycetota bacterium]|nr:tetratricopeptide repeat protein [Planctomycetota bacterium]